MIQLKNQITLQFCLGPVNNYSLFTDFISIDDFLYMTIQENAGGIRPLLTMTFKLKNEQLIPYLNGGNIITLQYGIDEPTSDLLQFSIEGDQQTKEYRSGAQITLVGAMYNPTFTENVGSQTYPDMKSFELFQKVAEESGLKLKTNVTKTNDKQNWYRTGQTNWEFIYSNWDQAYKDDTTFFSFALDNNNLYFYDIKEKLKQEVDWVLSVHHIGNNENSKIVNIGSYYPDDSNAGDFAQLVGKNETNITYNIDSGEFTTPDYKLLSYTSQNTNKLNLNTTGCQRYRYGICSGDVHENYTKAKNQNKRNNVLFSSYQILVPVPGQYRDFKLLDTVNLITGEKDPANEGYYIIAGMTKQYQNGQYQTNLLLTRESANGLKGDDLQSGSNTQESQEESKTTNQNIANLTSDDYFAGLFPEDYKTSTKEDYKWV